MMSLLKLAAVSDIWKMMASVCSAMEISIEHVTWDRALEGNIAITKLLHTRILKIRKEQDNHKLTFEDVVC